MKKTIFYLLAASLAFTFIPNEMKAASRPHQTESPADSVASQSKLISRLEEIKTMDRSALTRSEKRALRKEVRAIDKNLHDNYGGVYISVGGLIIIILLLIIFF